MHRRIAGWVKFHLERLLVRGTHVHLLVMVGLVGLVSILGGLIAASVDQSFESPSAAMWWAFLRLTDPGYIGDDQGVAKRVISTIITVLGYVLFMGSLVAIMTQWLVTTIGDLERGLTPIVAKDHLLVIGWTTRTAVIAREMLASRPRVRRFLARHDAHRLNLVMLVEDLTAQLRQDLREHVGPWFKERQIVLRSGTALEVEHLRRVDFLNAAAIVLPSDDVGEDSIRADARLIKTLFTIDHEARVVDDPPLIVAEVTDPRKEAAARHAYRGPLEIVSSSQLVARLIALSVLSPGLSPVLDELLVGAAGAQIHITDAGEAVGRTFGEAAASLKEACCIGVVSKQGGTYRATLLPPSDVLVTAADRLVTVALSHERAASWSVAASGGNVSDTTPVTSDAPQERRVLVLGWSDRVPWLLHELASYAGACASVDVVCEVDPARDLWPSIDSACRVSTYVGDITDPATVKKYVANSYDTVVIVASDWLATGSESDARTITSYLLVADALRAASAQPKVIVELAHPSNRSLFDHHDVDVIVSPLVIGRVLAQVTLRRELAAVYTALFSAAGPGLMVRPADTFGFDGDQGYLASELTAAAAKRGEVFVGVLDPQTLETTLAVAESDNVRVQGQHIIVLSPQADTTMRQVPPDEV